jgi:sterol desaturase/sphingolipid hydroxylase (fatty acid hydroxylase superfamily)
VRLVPGLEVVGGALLVTLFGVLLVLEHARPLRARVASRRDRLRTNLAMTAVAALVVRGLVIPTALALATVLASTPVGVVRLLGLGGLAAAVPAFLLMDYTTWLWHRLNHRVPVLWRFHAVHHTDLDLDVTTSFRFHFGELTLALVFRAAQVVLIGVEPAVLLLYELVASAATAFHHSNVRLPVGLERRLTLCVVTPRMHGIHHSIVERETNSNWSVVFSWWDRLHGTLRLDIAQAELRIGVPAYRHARELTFPRLLAMPFRPQRSTWRLPGGGRPDRAPAGPVGRLAE